jgi:hypothetical protein
LPRLVRTAHAKAVKRTESRTKAPEAKAPGAFVRLQRRRDRRQRATKKPMLYGIGYSHGFNSFFYEKSAEFTYF